MTEKVNGITVRAVGYKENDEILTVFTLEKGIITVSAKGIRKVNAKMKALKEPFCFAETVLAEKSGRYTATEVQTIDTFFSLRTDIKKYYLGTVALDYTNVFLREGMENPVYFDLLVNYLKDLTYTDINGVDLLCKFLYQALKISGYFVSLTACGRCGEVIKNKVYLSLTEGFCVCENCRKENESGFSIDTYNYLKRVCVGEYKEEKDETRKNGLKFFNYYIKKVADTELKCLDACIEIL